MIESKKELEELGFSIFDPFGTIELDDGTIILKPSIIEDLSYIKEELDKF